ncbi:hypothetical protein AH06_00395 [candidate division TM6 bacterium Zodletone_IIa]|jgi:hypothetical protein|nr:hypothetical protein AH06_00395 [candidate division TM6 bacterium Zodletone_IIa]MBA4197609.1 hypothetical protein [Chitinophaga sp.]
MKLLLTYIIYLVFLGLIIFSAWLYSLRWDFVPWGSHNNDGLFFLYYYIAVIPAMLLTAILKRLILKQETTAYRKNSFFLYLFLISIPALDTHGSQVALAFGFFICVVCLISTLYEITSSKFFIKQQQRLG